MLRNLKRKAKAFGLTILDQNQLVMEN
jgi:hypothetical protein